MSTGQPAHTERFAPSPTGELHLGHAYSALVGWRAARRAGGRFLLRMEDLDRSRVRPKFARGILDDLAWLGLDWDGPVVCQSARLAAYRAALADLTARGLTYACTCTRRDIAEAASAPQEGVPAGPDGPDGPVYPGTCRGRAHAAGASAATRLDMRRAIAALGGAAAVGALAFTELAEGPGGESGEIHLDPQALAEGTGDVVLARRDGTPAYHLAVVVDDAWQGVSHVTRGRDLFSATPLHRLLQALLGLPAPRWRHHRLIRDAHGRRLAKRDHARSLATLRAEGWSPAEIIRSLRQPPDLERDSTAPPPE
ncbi:MAG TPA: tRNA glutamyl-Q(34) synthetase GluQRS [Thermohalobaculum sp.]|nr:tRNA glutamyl-Q(34) synthetase GluQRS [Thermohalobaculum sp.]